VIFPAKKIRIPVFGVLNALVLLLLDIASLVLRFLNQPGYGEFGSTPAIGYAHRNAWSKCA
jgi:hypothetical protein